MQQMRDTTPHNYINKMQTDMYGANNNGGYSQNYQQQQHQPNYTKPYYNYGVDSNARPVVVSSGGGCCCSVM